MDQHFISYVGGMSIEKLFDMWRNNEIWKYYVICAAVSALACLSQFCTSKNRFRENSKIRHFVTYQITCLLTCHHISYKRFSCKKVIMLKFSFSLANNHFIIYVLMLLACHKKSYLICDEITNFRNITYVIFIYFQAAVSVLYFKKN